MLWQWFCVRIKASRRSPSKEY